MSSSERASIASRLGISPRPERLEDLPYRARVTIGALVLCGLLAGASLLGDGGSVAGRAPLAAAVLLAGVVTANGWTRIVDIPSRKGTAVVAMIAACATVLSVLVAPERRPLAWLPVGLAVSVIAAFGHQLVRTDGRPRVVASLAGSLLAIGLLASGACWIAMPEVAGGRRVVVAATAGLAVAAVVEGFLHRAGIWSAVLPVSMAVGGSVSALVAGALGAPWAAGLLLGIVSAAVAFACRAMLAPLPALTARRAQLVSSALSVLAAGSLAYLVARTFLAV